jgi:hypothetical protein
VVVTAGNSLAVYPVLPVDDAHLLILGFDGRVGQMYELAATPGLVLDASACKFRIPAQLTADRRVAVYVFIARNKQYIADWKPRDGKQVLDASNLKSMNQSKPFSGFRSGDSFLIALGYITIESGNPQLSNLLWQGMAKVK